jgi:hypothetical protein
MPNGSNQQKIKPTFQKPHFLQAKDAPADAGQSAHQRGYIEWLLAEMTSAFQAGSAVSP